MCRDLAGFTRDGSASGLAGSQRWQCEKMGSQMATARDNILTSFKAVATAALLWAVTAIPALAQPPFGDPDAFQAMYPYRDVLNEGAPTPAARLAFQPPSVLQAMQERESGIRSEHAQRAGTLATGTLMHIRSLVHSNSFACSADLSSSCIRTGQIVVQSQNTGWTRSLPRHAGRPLIFLAQRTPIRRAH